MMNYHQRRHQRNQPTGRKAQSRAFLVEIADRPLVTFLGTAGDLSALPLASSAIADFTRKCAVPGGITVADLLHLIKRDARWQTIITDRSRA